jgi:RNA polymerase sigma factor (sigma-70 family)
MLEAAVSEPILVRARSGDADAFRELVDPYRSELQVHCYRILGSLQDAEDLLQETLLAAWRGLGRFQGRASLRAWLYRIATNRCLNALRDRNTRSVSPFPEPPATSELEESGGYALVRHPIYGGVLLVSVAWSLGRSPWALIPTAALTVALIALTAAVLTAILLRHVQAGQEGERTGPNERGRLSAAQVRRDCRCRPVDFVARRSSCCATIW